MLLWVLAQQADRSRIGPPCAQHALDGGALPCPVGPQQTEDRTAPHREVQVIHHRFPAVVFGQSPDNDRLAHSETLLMARSSM